MFFVFVAIVLAVIGLILGILNTVSTAREVSEETNDAWRKKEFSLTGKLLLLLGVMVFIASIPTFIVGMVYSDYSYLGCFIFVAIALSIVFAYVCSPLRLTFLSVLGIGEGNPDVTGCLTMAMYAPIGFGVGVFSFVALFACSWIYAILAILRGSKTWLRVVSIILVAVVIAGIPVGLLLPDYLEKTFRQNAIEKIENAVSSLSTEQVVFSKRELNSLWSSEDTYFQLEEASEVVGEKFAELYRNNDFDGIMKLVKFVFVNDQTFFVRQQRYRGRCMGFENEFLQFVINGLAQKGTLVRENCYRYDCFEATIFNNNHGVSFTGVDGVSGTLEMHITWELSSLIEERKLYSLYYMVGRELDTSYNDYD